MGASRPGPRNVTLVKSSVTFLVLANLPDLRCYRCYPRSASTFSGLSNEPRNFQLYSEAGSAAAVFGYPGTTDLDSIAFLRL